MWRPFRIPYPLDPEGTDEQVEILDPIDQKFELHRRKRSAAADVFKALLHKLMPGEIQVRGLDLLGIGHSGRQLLSHD